MPGDWFVSSLAHRKKSDIISWFYWLLNNSSYGSMSLCDRHFPAGLPIPSLLFDACLDAVGPAQQMQMLLQNPTETSPCSGGETWYPSKLRVVTNSIIAGWEQGRRVTQPFPRSCIKVFVDDFKWRHTKQVSTEWVEDASAEHDFMI